MRDQDCGNLAGGYKQIAFPRSVKYSSFRFCKPRRDLCKTFESSAIKTSGYFIGTACPRVYFDSTASIAKPSSPSPLVGLGVQIAGQNVGSCPSHASQFAREHPQISNVSDSKGTDNEIETRSLEWKTLTVGSYESPPNGNLCPGDAEHGRREINSHSQIHSLGRELLEPPPSAAR